MEDSLKKLTQTATYFDFLISPKKTLKQANENNPSSINGKKIVFCENLDHKASLKHKKERKYDFHSIERLFLHNESGLEVYNTSPKKLALRAVWISRDFSKNFS